MITNFNLYTSIMYASISHKAGLKIIRTDETFIRKRFIPIEKSSRAVHIDGGFMVCSGV